MVVGLVDLLVDSAATRFLSLEPSISGVAN